MRATEKVMYINKTTMASVIYAVTHTTYGGSKPQEKKRKKTDYLLSGQCGTFIPSMRFRQRYRSRASGFQNIRRDGNSSLGHAQRRKNGTKQKTKVYNLSGRTIGILLSIPSHARFQGRKTC